jgi:hypothetical protein
MAINDEIGQTEINLMGTGYQGQLMLISSQQIAIVAAITHREVHDFKQQIPVNPARGKPRQE